MAKDNYTKDWIIANAIDVCSRYRKGILTLRSLHYQLVSIGMTNDLNHYKRVVSAMIDARWAGIISFDTFSDLDRGLAMETDAKVTVYEESVSGAKDSIKAWMEVYYLNRWENQPVYPEVWIEKKALQGVFGDPCRRARVALGACKGYPSLTFLHEAKERFMPYIDAGKNIIIVYFGDYDPSGEDIPRSVGENLERMGVEVEVKRIALMEKQVVEWGLPPAPAKVTDTRSAKWEGLGQVELDAVKPEVLQSLVRDSLREIFDEDLYEELKERETEERGRYVIELKEYVKTL